MYKEIKVTYIKIIHTMKYFIKLISNILRINRKKFEPQNNIKNSEILFLFFHSLQILFLGITYSQKIQCIQ